MYRAYPANLYLFKVNNRNTRKRYEICSELSIQAPEQRQWCVSVVDFEQVNVGWQEYKNKRKQWEVAIFTILCKKILVLKMKASNLLKRTLLQKFLWKFLKVLDTYCTSRLLCTELGLGQILGLNVKKSLMICKENCLFSLKLQACNWNHNN